ncbi:MAG: hypothetical protein ABJ275_09410 [Maricaulaceae bacterium]
MTINFLKLTSFSLLALTLAIPSTAFAGAWTADQGDNYLKGAVNYFETSSRFGPENGFENFRNTNLNLYWEYGLRDNLTFFATGSYTDLENEADGQETSGDGVGDIDVGLRYRLIDGPVIVSVQGLFKAPYLYSEDAELPLGNGQEDFEGKLLFGKSFGALGYGGLEVGYRVRTEDPVDEFRFLVEYGFDVNEKTYLRAKLDGIHAAQNADVDLTNAVLDIEPETGNPFGPDIELLSAASTLNPQLPLEFDLGRLEYTAGYKINDNLAMEITGTTAVYGDNTLKGTNVQFAIVSSF